MHISIPVGNCEERGRHVKRSFFRMEQNEEQTGVHAVKYELTVDYMRKRNRCSLRRILMQPNSEQTP